MEELLRICGSFLFTHSMLAIVSSTTHGFSKLAFRLMLSILVIIKLYKIVEKSSFIHTFENRLLL